MGWVPESEDPVPMLDEEEMADVKVKLQSKGSDDEENVDVPTVQSIDVGV